MRHLFRIAVVMMFSLTFTHTGFCGDWGGMIGGTYWRPDWDRERSDGSTDGLFGPSVSIRFKDLILSAQYYTGEFDIDFPGSSRTYSADRTDLDIALSCRFLGFLNATVGYKNIDFDWVASYQIDASISGLAIGAGGSYTFAPGLLLYSSASYMPALDYRWDYGGVGETFDATGYTLDAGTGWVFSKIHLMTRIGYRYQSFDVEQNGSSDILDETNQGFKVDVAYLF